MLKKLDGIRCIIKQGELFTSSLKSFNNVNVIELLLPIVEYTKEHNILLDGELLSHSTLFNDFSGIVRSDEMELPKDTFFYGFDKVSNENYEEPFETRICGIGSITQKFDSIMKQVSQVVVNSPEDVLPLYEEALAWGCDGVMLRNPQGRYKLGRATMKEGLIFKVKPYITFDSKIIGVVRGTEVDPNAPKEINEMGYSTTSKKKGDRILIEKATAFLVLHEGNELKVSIAATDQEKEEIWHNKDQYINKHIEYKGLIVGSKELPRHPVMLRFRKDLD